MNQAFLSFNNGEVTPYLRHRTDLEKHGSSAELMQNFLSMPYGGVIKRPGLVYEETTADAGRNSRLLPFIASTGDRYLLHFTEDLLTIYRANGTVADTCPFLAGYSWPGSFDWNESIRDIQIVQVNDVAFFTHPASFPLQLSRIADTDWTLAFIDFPRAPMLDDNTDKTKTFTIASNPIASSWADGASYAAGDKAFATSEWYCFAAHTANTSTNRPGTGSNWRNFWRRMFYKAGDPITLLTDDRSEIAWGVEYQNYVEGDVVLYSGQSPPYVADASNLALCLEDHTTDAGYSFGALTDETLPPTVGEKWVHLNPWEVDVLSPASSYGVGECCYRGDTAWKCLSSHGPYGLTPDADPGTGSLTDFYWEELAPVPVSVGEFAVANTYASGSRVSHEGLVYAANTTHVAATANRPGVGAVWTLLSGGYTGAFAAGVQTPGLYYKISPERADADFQAEIAAISGNNGQYSAEIVVEGAWNFFTYGTWSGTFSLERSVNGGISWETIRSWQGTADRNVADSGFEDSAVILKVKWTHAADGSSNPRGVLIPETNYVTGYALMDTYLGSNAMTGFAKTSLISGNTYRWAEGAFSLEYGFPRALALHASRLCFAGTERNPVSFWISADDDLNNFQTGVLATDGIFRTLALSNSSPIRWLISQRQLFIGTAFGEWVMGSENSDAGVTATAPVRQYTSYGSHGLQPLVANGSVLFVSRKGTRVHELGYTSDRETYDAADLTLLAEHLTQEGISNMAWQQTREPGLWVVLRSGMLLHLSYSRTERVRAWSRHVTEDGLFRDVAVIPSDEGDDEVFFIIDRGGDSCLERFPQHWQAAYEAGSGYRCVDGDDDLAIVSKLRSLPVDLAAQDGSTHAGRKRQHKVSLSLFQSSGGFIWNTLESRKQPVTTASATLTTGWKDIVPDAGNLDDLQFNLYHADPYPFILRAAILRWSFNENQ